MSVDHWMMFGTFAQQEAFAYPTPDTYTGVVINANMVAYAPAGLAAFLHERTATSTYIIDPQTHAFQHDPETISNREGETKSSVASLADHYGHPVATVVGKRPLLPADLHEGAKRAQFVERCIRFQTDELTARMHETDAAKYLDVDEVEQPPYAVVAPYFFMSETTIHDWMEVNLSCIEDARNYCDGPSKLFASIVIDQGVLEDPDLRNDLASKYSKSNVDGVLIWVDDFDEQTTSRLQLRALVDFAAQLRTRGREVINLHGGFFSILAGSELGGNAFSGVTHGPEFGEYRGVIPVGGGIPISRYYIPQLHARIRYRDALRMLREKGWLRTASAFHSNVCNCDVCTTALAGDAKNYRRFGESNVRTVRRKGGLVRIDFPTKQARDICLKHYLERKHREYRAADEFTVDQLVSAVSRGYHQFSSVAGLEGVKHLDLWLRAFGRKIVPEDELGAA
jgi:hypothetical protein